MALIPEPHAFLQSELLGIALTSLALAVIVFVKNRWPQSHILTARVLFLTILLCVYGKVYNFCLVRPRIAVPYYGGSSWADSTVDNGAPHKQ
jgi:hypothetical protein